MRPSVVVEVPIVGETVPVCVCGMAMVAVRVVGGAVVKYYERAQFMSRKCVKESRVRITYSNSGIGSVCSYSVHAGIRRERWRLR